MKLAKLTTVYPAYLRKLYRRHQRLSDATYSDQKAVLDYDGFGWFDAWTCALAPFGYEVLDVTANVAYLQRAWHKEHCATRVRGRSLLAIAKEQVLQFRPDVLFIEDHNYFPYDWLIELKDACPSIRLTLGWCGAPYYDQSVFRAFDVVLSCIPEMVEHFRRHGHKASHVNHAFDPRILNRITHGSAKTIDVSFVGQVGGGQGMHSTRERLFRELTLSYPVSIYSPSNDLTFGDHARWLMIRGVYESMQVVHRIGVSKELLAKVPVVGKLALMTRAPAHQVSGALKPYLRPGVFGLTMYQTLRDSKVTLNSHIDASPHSASNMRLFEATGVGTCLLTDWKENIGQLFATDDEVATYRTPAECLDKLRWLLEHPSEREEMARRGQERTLRDHTFQQRAPELVHIITTGLGAARGSLKARADGHS